MLDVSDVYIYIHTNTYISIDTCIYIRCIACESGIAYWNGIKPGLRAQTGAGETYSHNLPKKTGQAQPWTERKKGGHRSNHKHKATCCLPANSTRNTKHTKHDAEPHQTPHKQDLPSKTRSTWPNVGANCVAKLGPTMSVPSRGIYMYVYVCKRIYVNMYI